MKRICVFCGSNKGNDPAYTTAAEQVGAELARRGIGLVYGGGRIGLMGVVADAVLSAGGEVVGVIPAALDEREVAHRGLTELRVVNSMHERKALMAELADAFIALPGGFGTFEELCEIITWAQLGFIKKPCGILNVSGYYEPLLQMFDAAVNAGFIRLEHRALVLQAEDAAELIDRLTVYRPPQVEKWLELEQT